MAGVRTYDTDAEDNVNENMAAEEFSKVSNETLGVYSGDLESITDGDVDGDRALSGVEVEDEEGRADVVTIGDDAGVCLMAERSIA